MYTIFLQANKLCGFVQKLYLRCSYCEESGLESFQNTTYSSKKIEKFPEVYDINLRIALGFLSLGRGYRAIEKFSMFTNIECFSKMNFQKYVNIANIASMEIVNKGMETARKIVKDTLKSGPGESSIEPKVSFDGSWPTRGFRSNYGIGCVIDVTTGFVIDFEIMSKNCFQCAITKAQLGEESPEFDRWYEGHKSECSKNHEGSSGAMEMKAAEAIWKRSESYGLKYTTMVSDGDSKTLHHLNELQVYGPQCVIQKEACSNHVGKR